MLVHQVATPEVAEVLGAASPVVVGLEAEVGLVAAAPGLVADLVVVVEDLVVVMAAPLQLLMLHHPTLSRTLLPQAGTDLRQFTFAM